MLLQHSVIWVESITIDIVDRFCSCSLVILEWKLRWILGLELVSEHSNLFGRLASHGMSLTCRIAILLLRPIDDLGLSILPGKEVSNLASELSFVVELGNILWALYMEEH